MPNGRIGSAVLQYSATMDKVYAGELRVLPGVALPPCPRIPTFDTPWIHSREYESARAACVRFYYELDHYLHSVITSSISD